MSGINESMWFRDVSQQMAVCNRLVQFGHFNERDERFELPDFSHPERIRRARTLFDLALALFDGDGNFAMNRLVNLDHETQEIVSDLLISLCLQSGTYTDLWLENTEAFFDSDVERAW